MLSLLLLVAPPPVIPTDFMIDLTPLKAPLDQAARCLERAVTLAEAAKADLATSINWTLIGIAVVLTSLVLHAYHLHGLAASKTNRQ